MNKMKNLSIVALLLGLFLAVSCSKEPTPAPEQNTDQTNVAYRGNEIPNTPAYFDGELFTINLMEMSEQASAAIIANNSGLNEIYAYADLDEEQPFLPIIDAVPGSDMNPMWFEVEIEFNDGFAPRQFTSEEELDAAVEAGEITLTETDEVYRCSVINHL
jgi:hypothetical protein